MYISACKYVTKRERERDYAYMHINMCIDNGNMFNSMGKKRPAAVLSIMFIISMKLRSVLIADVHYTPTSISKNKNEMQI